MLAADTPWDEIQTALNRTVRSCYNRKHILNCGKRCSECGDPIGSDNLSGTCRDCGHALRKAKAKAKAAPPQPLKPREYGYEHDAMIGSKRLADACFAYWERRQVQATSIGGAAQ